MTKQPFLLVAPLPAAEAAADALRSTLDCEVRIAADRRSALAAMRRESFALVLVDETLAAQDDPVTAQMYTAAGAAAVLEINFAITGAARVTRLAQAALARRGHDLADARRVAAFELSGELAGPLSGLLLETELLLREASPATAPRIRHLVALAGDLRERLRMTA